MSEPLMWNVEGLQTKKVSKPSWFATPHHLNHS